MKNFLFATSALVASAGIASADFSMSATAKLTYGNYGTGHSRAGDATVNAAALQQQQRLLVNGCQKLTLTSQ